MQMTTWNFGKIIVAFGLVGALLCGALSFIAIPDKYTSDCTLRYTGSLLPGGPQPAKGNTDEEWVKSLMHNALSRSSLTGVIEKQGLYQRERTSKPMEDVIDKMRRDVSFERIGDSNLFHVRFRYSDAKLARRAEWELINRLMQANVSMRRALSRSRPDLPGSNDRFRFLFNLEVLVPASLPEHPSSPNRLLIAAMGLAGGLLLGVITAGVARTRLARIRSSS